MLIYEKKVGGVRHLFGTNDNIPAAGDSQLVYKDIDGDTLTLSTTDKFVDAFDANGNRGIKRLSDGKFFGVFIGNAAKAIIPKGWEPEAKEVKSVSVKEAPTTVTWNQGDQLSMVGLKLNVTYKDGDKVVKQHGDAGITYSPAEGTALQASDTKVTITFGGKSCEQAITVVPPVAEEPEEE